MRRFILYSTLLYTIISFRPENKALKEIIPTIGFSKVNITEAGIYEDPIPDDKINDNATSYAKAEKFGITDRIKTRWHPGSGHKRRVVDSIYIAAMYGEDERGPWAIITLDEMEIFYGLLDRLEYPLIHQMGIAKERLIFLPSHSHSTPPMNADKYQQAVLEAVTAAKNNRTEVEMASLDLRIDGRKYVINRRVYVDSIGTNTVLFNDDCVVHENFLDATGSVLHWKKNLGAEFSQAADFTKKYNTTGEIDNTLQAIFFRDKKSRDLKGSFIRFAAHAVIVSSKMVDGDVSADFPGYLKHKIETALGGIALFAQGASGDLRPLNKAYSHGFAKNYGESLAGQIIKSYSEIKWKPLSTLRYYAQPLTLGIADSLYYDEQDAQSEMNKVETQYDKEVNTRSKCVLQNKYWKLFRTPDVIGMIRPDWRKKKSIDLYMYAIQLNEKVIMAVNGELFTRIGQQMTQPFNDKNPLLVTIANESISYVPTDEEKEKGGYEPSVSITAIGSGDTLIRQAHRFLAHIYNNPLDIKKESCSASPNQPAGKQILKNEVDEIDTYYIELTSGNTLKYRTRPDSVSIFLMTRGKALIQQGSAQFTASGLNLFVPSRNEATVVADKEGLEMLEIVIRLTPDEMQTFENLQQVLPYFVDYTKCRQYREAIKSEKTISRMILPENIVPRFCMGSVQTTGADEVGAHTHPMLEQLFFGLPGNDCIVSADGIQTSFKENTLLHIPLGSKHGVKVDQGKTLHYIWMDHFRNADDMWYMKANHFMKDDK